MSEVLSGSIAGNEIQIGWARMLGFVRGLMVGWLRQLVVRASPRSLALGLDLPTPGSGSRATSAPSWFLEYVVDPGPPCRLGRMAVHPLPFGIGRDPGLALVIPSSGVSRRHAELFVRDGDLRVRDLGSKNGTYVNRSLVSEAPLAAGDVIRFAEAEFRLGCRAGGRDAAPVPPEPEAEGEAVAATYRTLGIEGKGGVFVPVLQRDSPVPALARRVFTTVADGQHRVEVHVLRGESDRAALNQSLARLEIDGLSTRPPGCLPIRVTFEIDAAGVLTVAAEDLETGRARSVKVRSPGLLCRVAPSRLAERARARDRAIVEGLARHGRPEGPVGVSIAWRGEVVGRLYAAGVETRDIDSRHRETRVRGWFVSTNGPEAEEFWRHVQLADASPRVNEGPGLESFFMRDWGGIGGWLVVVARRPGRGQGSMAELSLLAEHARARLAEERDREETECARESLGRILDGAPPWAWPMLRLAPASDAWRRVWKCHEERPAFTVRLRVGGHAFACRLVSVNESRVCVLTRAPVMGGELGTLEAVPRDPPTEVRERIGVEGVFERILSGLGKRPLRRLLAEVNGPRSSPVMAVLRILPSGPDPEWLPRPPLRRGREPEARIEARVC